MADYAKPLPLPDPDTQPFWEAAKAHELKAQKCSKCGKFRWPPRGVCPHCYSWDFAWTKVAETGAVVSYVVVHQATNPVFAQDVPYVIAKVAIDGTDGEVILNGNVLDCPWEDVKVGMRLRAVYDDVTPEVTLPKFKPE
ncbi:MAG TPA: OB-fold domain-containing protein [Chloroflexota bacterium]